MPILKNIARPVSLSVRVSGTSDAPYTATTWPDSAVAKMWYSKDGAAPVAIIPTRIDATLGGWLLSVATMTAGVWNCDELRIFWEGTGIASGSEKFYPEAHYTDTVAGRIDENVSAPKTLTAGERTAIKVALEAAGSSLDTLLGRLTAGRAGYLDNLNVGGLVASAGNLLNVSNNTRLRATIPTVLERPDAGSETLSVAFELYDESGNMEAPDATPTIALTSQSGADLSARLSALANPAPGRYTATYTNAAAHALEVITWVLSVTEGGATRTYSYSTQIVDTTAADFTTADRAKLANVEALAAALPLLAQIRADLERAGGMLDLTKTQATTGATQATTGATQATAAATSSASADGKLTAPRLAKIDGSQQAGSAVTLPNPAPTGYGASAQSNPGPVSFGPYALEVGDGDSVVLHVGDLATLEFEARDQGGAVNLTGATVTVDVRDYYSGEALTDDGAATVVYALGGRIRYQLQAADTSAARTLRITAKVVFAGGGVKTYGPLIARVEI